MQLFVKKLILLNIMILIKAILFIVTFNIMNNNSHFPFHMPVIIFYFTIRHSCVQIRSPHFLPLFAFAQVLLSFLRSNDDPAENIFLHSPSSSAKLSAGPKEPSPVVFFMPVSFVRDEIEKVLFFGKFYVNVSREQLACSC